MELFYRVSFHEVAADALSLVEECELSSKHALERLFRQVAGKDREKARGLAHAYVFEIEKWRAKIDFIINSVLKGSTIDDLDPYLANLLRIGAFEVHFRKVPPTVATDSIVRVVKGKFDFSKAKFVNVLMHSIEKFDVEEALKELKERDRIE